MSNILLCAPMLDNQSGTYIYNSLVQMGHRVATFDWRLTAEQLGADKIDTNFINAHKELKPDLTIICKGLGISGEAVKEVKSFHKNPITCWIFDVTIGGTMVAETKSYVDFIKEVDTFYTIDNDALEDLKKLGVNAKWLTEGCYIPDHDEAVFNSFQGKKYGADIVFLGSVGSIHKNREKFLKRIHDEGFDFKIYGNVFYQPNEEPDWIIEHHTGFEAINNYHSIISQASKIVIGLDGWTDRSKAWSARLYRTLCPGGFYLTTHTKDIEKYFKSGETLDTFKDEDEMVEKILYWLNNDEKRQKVAKAGQKLVKVEYTFKKRLQEIIDDNK